MKQQRRSLQNSSKPKKKTSEARKFATKYNAVDAESDSMLEIKEHFCERRGEYVAHVRAVDGGYLCMSGEFCLEACEAKRAGDGIWFG